MTSDQKRAKLLEILYKQELDLKGVAGFEYEIAAMKQELGSAEARLAAKEKGLSEFKAAAKKRASDRMKDIADIL